MTETPSGQLTSLFSGPDAPNEDDLYKCVHCGFCLQACPTYVETGLETESPRGRIALMKAVNEGRIKITPTVIRHWDLCIQCQACEVACPSGVPYSHLIESVMAQVKRHRRLSLAPRLVTSILLDHVLPHQRRLRLLVSGLRLYQRTGLENAIRVTHILEALSPKLASLEEYVPSVPATRFEARGQVIPAIGTQRARVGLLAGCVMPLVQGPQMDAITRVLARNGCEVEVVRDQVCCGAIHTHVGDLEQARSLARRNIDVFLAANVDAIIVASAGCGSRMKEYDHLLKDDPDYAEKAQVFSERVKDIHEFLVDLPFIPPKAIMERRVTYQDSCHLSNPQGITEAPRILLRSIPGLELIELDHTDRCCGSGGTYALTQREFSLRLLENKMTAVRETGADVLATANPGCVLQLQYGAQKHDMPVQVRYVTEILDQAYRTEGKT